MAATATTEGLGRRAVWLEWATIGWNSVEAVVSITAGVVAGSVALVGFGLDSIVEVTAAGVVLWELNGVARERERRALRLIGLSFFALAAYVVAEAVRDLVMGDEAAESPVGIVMAGCSLLVMPFLARAKRRTGQRLHRHALEADAAETALCAWLSAILLAGLLLNATVGWWWADPLAALVIAGLAVREGREAWKGHDCC